MKLGVEGMKTDGKADGKEGQQGPGAESFISGSLGLVLSEWPC